MESERNLTVAPELTRMDGLFIQSLPRSSAIPLRSVSIIHNPALMVRYTFKRYRCIGNLETRRN